MFFYLKKVIGMLLLCSLFMGTIPARTVRAEDAQPDLPAQKGTVVGEIVYLVGDTLLYREEIVTAETVERIDFLWCLTEVCRIFLPG